MDDKIYQLKMLCKDGTIRNYSREIGDDWETDTEDPEVAREQMRYHSYFLLEEIDEDPNIVCIWADRIDNVPGGVHKYIMYHKSESGDFVKTDMIVEAESEEEAVMMTVWKQTAPGEHLPLMEEYDWAAVPLPEE